MNNQLGSEVFHVFGVVHIEGERPKYFSFGDRFFSDYSSRFERLVSFDITRSSYESRIVTRTKENAVYSRD